MHSIFVVKLKSKKKLNENFVSKGRGDEPIRQLEYLNECTIERKVRGGKEQQSLTGGAILEMDDQ